MFGIGFMELLLLTAICFVVFLVPAAVIVFLVLRARSDEPNDR